MNDQTLRPRFTLGTSRLCSPETTKRRITPLLRRCGITRVGEITGLDEDFGVPTYTAIRPAGLTLQTGNGKGLTRAAAWVSAAMEALELEHAESPPLERFVRASEAQMRERGRHVLVPPRDPEDLRFHYSPQRVVDWIEAEDLIAKTRPWIPASAAFYVEPTIYRTNTNGLASGNHIVEATLHALYELLERDAISSLVSDEALDIRGRCRVVDVTTLADERLCSVMRKIHAADSQLVLMSVPTTAPVHVFWAVLLNHQPHRAAAALVTGAGAHTDLGIAASRAITEAVQSRLTIVQAARDDLVKRPSFRSDSLGQGAAFRFFAELEADTHWSELEESAKRRSAPAELGERLAHLLRALAALGHEHVLRVDLRKPELDLPVVKVMVPSLDFRRELF